MREYQKTLDLLKKAGLSGQRLREAEEALSKDIGQDEIDRVKTLLEEGKYEIDPEVVAGKVIDHATAATALDKSCDELTELLGKDGDEEIFHQWLNDPCHKLFLDPYAEKVWSKPPVGNKGSDFVVRRSDGTYILIEIERPDLLIFRRDNSEPTADFNHACQQVRDWKRYIRDNIHTVRNELGLEKIYEPKGMVICGRTEDIVGKEAQVRWLDMKNTYDISLATYDEIINNVRALSSNLRRIANS